MWRPLAGALAGHRGAHGPAESAGRRVVPVRSIRNLGTAVWWTPQECARPRFRYPAVTPDAPGRTRQRPTRPARRTGPDSSWSRRSGRTAHSVAATSRTRAAGRSSTAPGRRAAVLPPDPDLGGQGRPGTAARDAGEPHRQRDLDLRPGAIRPLAVVPHAQPQPGVGARPPTSPTRGGRRRCGRAGRSAPRRPAATVDELAHAEGRRQLDRLPELPLGRPVPHEPRTPPAERGRATASAATSRRPPRGQRRPPAAASRPSRSTTGRTSSPAVRTPGRHAAMVCPRPARRQSPAARPALSRSRWRRRVSPRQLASRPARLTARSRRSASGRDRRADTSRAWSPRISRVVSSGTKERPSRTISTTAASSGSRSSGQVDAVQPGARRHGHLHQVGVELVQRRGLDRDVARASAGRRSPGAGRPRAATSPAPG